MKVAVLGGGPAGLTAAKFAADAGFDIDLFEKSNRLGGLHRSVEVDGLHYDIGTFVFHTNHALIEAFPGLADQMVPIRYRPISITPKESVDRYPFTLSRYVRDNGTLAAVWALIDLAVSKFKYRNFKTVPEFAYYYMGRRLYKTSGLEDYIRRLHGAEAEELDVDFARKRMTQISKMSIRNLIATKLRKLKGEKILKLQDRTARPKSGFAPFYGHIERELRDRDVNIHFDSNIESINKCEDNFEIVVNGTAHRYQHIVSTLPIPVALRLCGLPTHDVTETRSLHSLFYRGKLKYEAPVIFNFTARSEWKRITVFSKFYEMPADGRDYLTVEITGDSNDSESIAACRRDFELHAADMGLFLDEPKFVGSYFTEDAYPVYRCGTTEAVKSDKDRLKEYGIDSIGRQGNFDYVISHWVALAARELVEAKYQNQTSTDESTVVS